MAPTTEKSGVLAEAFLAKDETEDGDGQTQHSGDRQKHPGLAGGHIRPQPLIGRVHAFLQDGDPPGGSVAVRRFTHDYNIKPARTWRKG